MSGFWVQAMPGNIWDATAADVRRALSLYRIADAILIVVLAALAALLIAPA